MAAVMILNPTLAEEYLAQRETLPDDQRREEVWDGVTYIMPEADNPHDKIASFLCVRPNLSYHMVALHGGSANLVAGIHPINNGNIRINGGYFIFNRRIFDYMEPGEELVNEPFGRLVAEERLIGYQYDGFWAGMDTFKDKQQLENLYGTGGAPWEVWKNGNSESKNESESAEPPVLEQLVNAHP